MPDEDRAEIFRRAYRALNEEGTDAILEFLDPEVEFHSAPGFTPDADVYRGHEGVRRWFANLADAFADVRFEPQEVIVSEDRQRAFVEVLITGHGRATGLEGEVTLYQAWTLKDDMATRLQAFLDRDEALRAVGLAEGV